MSTSLVATALAPNFKAILEALNKSSAEVAGADPKDVQEVAGAQLRIINSYYVSVLQQARQSFFAALVAAGIGLLFFLGAVAFLLASDESLVGAASVISGALVEVIAGINFYLYGRAGQQLAAFHVALDRTQRFLLANSLCENLSDAARDDARSKLIGVISSA